MRALSDNLAGLQQLLQKGRQQVRSHRAQRLLLNDDPNHRCISAPFSKPGFTLAHLNPTCCEIFPK